MSLGKPTIKLVFMDDDMRDYAINEATKALETSNSEKVSLSSHNSLPNFALRRFNLIIYPPFSSWPLT